MSEEQQQTQEQQQQQKHSDKVQNIDIFLQVSQYLNMSELGRMNSVNKQMKKNCEEFYRQKLYKMKYITEQQFLDVQNTDYSKIYKQIYNRDVLFTNISQFPIDKTTINDLKVFRSRSQKKLFNIGIKKFSIGTKFTAFQTHENVLYFCKTSEYFANEEDFEYIKRDNVVKFSTQPRNFMYLTEQGSVHIVFHDEEKSSKDLQERVLEWTLEIPVNHFKASFGMAAFLIKETEDVRARYSATLNKLVSGGEINIKNNKNDKTNDNQQGQVDDTKLNIVIYHVNDIIPEDINNPIANNQRMKRVNEYQFNDTLSFAIGYHQLLLVGLDHKLYYVDLSNYFNLGGVQPNVLPAKIYEALSKKYITKVFSGAATFFAYEREEIPPIDQWDTQMLMEFLSTVEEFKDYINIVKYEGIKGSDFSNITKSFMKDRLGLIRDDVQVKLRTEINKYRERTYKPERLYGWGKNDSGQLGLSKCTNVNIPTKIDLPTLKDSDEIDVIKVGWKNSLIVTREKRIFISENRERKLAEKKAEKQSSQDANDDEEEEKKDNSRNNKKTSKRSKKDSEDLTYKDKNSKSNNNNNNNNNSKNNSKSNNNNGNNNNGNNNNSSKSSSSQANQQFDESKSRWIEITDKFEELKDKRRYEIIEVSCAKDTVCVLGNCYQNKKVGQVQRQQEQENNQYGDDDEEELKKKLTPVMPILNRIRWDPAFDKSEFKIIYQDRFLKDLELDFETFEESDVKSYRITHIKRNNKIVWDREKKFEDFS